MLANGGSCPASSQHQREHGSKAAPLESTPETHNRGYRAPEQRHQCLRKLRLSVTCSGHLGVLRRDADHATHLRRRIELPLALAALGGEVPHQILVGVAKDVVVLGAVLREIQLRFLENADQVRQPVHHRLAFAELVRIVEVGEVAAGEPLIGLHERRNDLDVDLVADAGLPLQRDHVLEARALGDGDGRGELRAVAVLVGDVLDEEHEQNVVLVLTRVHAAAEFIARLPDGGIEIGFLDGHERRVRVWAAR